MRKLRSIIMVFFVIASIPAAISAQTVTAGARVLHDDIPATIQQYDLGLISPLGDRFVTATTYRYVFADQSEFNGLPNLRVAVHSLEQLVETHIPAWNVNLSAKGILTRVHSGALAGDYAIAARYNKVFRPWNNGKTVVLTVRSGGGRHRDLSVTTAIAENVSASYVEAAADITFMERFHFTANAHRDWYMDGNRKDVAYAYGLADLLSAPRLAVGYAYSWSDSEFSTWRMTGSTYDPRQRRYTYDYFYYPYFTPLQERGHIFIGIFQWLVTSDVMFHAKASVPFSSRGQLKYMPEVGRAPDPIDFGVRYDVEDILPTQYEAGIIATFLQPLTLALSVEYFSKPYYSYFGGGLSFQYAIM